MQLEIDFAKELEDPAIAALDVSMFAPGDLVNLILQRSEVLWDVPRAGQVIRAWNAGEMGPIEAETARLGDEIARRTAAVIHAEYKAMKPVLDRIPMGQVADIGCGYAFWDLFVARDFGSQLVLIDLEENEHRHFGFEAEGAAYSSLSVASEMLRANGVLADAITCVNPAKSDPEKAGPVDLAVSMLSCGFHYPVDSYVPFFTNSVRPGGHILVDLRARTAAAQAAVLAPLGPLEDLAAPPKARRVLVRRDVARS